MNLNFIKSEDGWIAEFEVSADFNLHIEGVKIRDINVYQSSVNGSRYSIIGNATKGLSSLSEVYDMDFSAIVYPKFIKVVCATEPLVGIMTEQQTGENAVEIIEGHFEFNDLKEYTDELAFGTALTETQYGDFYSLVKKLEAFVREHGEVNVDEWYTSGYIFDKEVIDKYVNMTFNGYSPDEISFYSSEDSPTSINIYLGDGPFNGWFCTEAYIYEDRVEFWTV